MSADKPTIPCEIRVGATHFQEGIAVETVQGAIDRLWREYQRQDRILMMPVLEPFLAASVAEAKHQIYRWGEEHDAQKTAWDWFWTLGYLGQKAAHSALIGDWDKAKHHTITAAAMLANWHRHITQFEARFPKQ